jgi:hypothetical protein
VNYSTAIFLINPKVRAIAAIYEPDTDSRKAPRTVFKTFDQTISTGDYILVPTETRHKMTVNKVVEVDVEPDLESAACMHWVIGTVDRVAFEDVLTQEARAIELMKAAEKTHAREELRKKMMAHVDETKLNALQITRMTGDGIEVIAAPDKPAQ